MKLVHNFSLIQPDYLIAMQREVICADACEWLQDKFTRNELFCGSVFTSLPDISEISHLFAGSADTAERVQRYEEWFTHQAFVIMSLLAPDEYVIFLQSDARIQNPSDGRILKWLDKSFLCSKAAEQSNCRMMWHKLVHYGDINSRSAGRPAYSHLLCYSKVASYDSGQFFIPDIFHRGDMIWTKGIGLQSAFAGVAFLKFVAKTTKIIDPFCGYGTVLAMSNCFQVDSLGVEISAKRCRKARSLDLSIALSKLTRTEMSMLGAPKSFSFSQSLDHVNDSEVTLDVSDDEINVVTADAPQT